MDAKDYVTATQAAKILGFRNPSYVYRHPDLAGKKEKILGKVVFLRSDIETLKKEYAPTAKEGIMRRVSGN